MAEHALGAGAGAVGLPTMGEHQPHEVFVLRTDGALQYLGGRLVHLGAQKPVKRHTAGMGKRAILSQAGRFRASESSSREGG